MTLPVKQIMKRNITTTASHVTLPDLEKAFLENGVSGFPVVDDGELVGIITRSDIVRQLVLEQELAETTSDYFYDETGFHEVPLVTFEQIADRVGERISELRVQNVMSRRLIKVSPDESVQAAAQKMVDNHIHRVLVTRENRLVGVVTSVDCVKLIANGQLVERP